MTRHSEASNDGDDREQQSINESTQNTRVGRASLRSLTRRWTRALTRIARCTYPPVGRDRRRRRGEASGVVEGCAAQRSSLSSLSPSSSSSSSRHHFFIHIALESSQHHRHPNRRHPTSRPSNSLPSPLVVVAAGGGEFCTERARRVDARIVLNCDCAACSLEVEVGGL